MSADRAAAILARFNAAHNFLVGTLRDLSPEIAEQHPSAQLMTAAQIGCHVAMANEWTAGVLMGTTPAAQNAPEDFIERFKPNAVPPMKTFPLPPPEVVTSEVALDRLRISAHRVLRAIASLTEERGSKYCVALPFGSLSLFELADYTATHAAHHAAQIERYSRDTPAA